MKKTRAVRKAAGYARSAVAGADAIGGQLTALAGEASSQGLDLVAAYIDNGCSGNSLATRPRLRQLLRDAKKGRFSHLLVDDLARLARGSGLLARVVDELHRHGVVLCSIKDGVVM